MPRENSCAPGDPGTGDAVQRGIQIIKEEKGKRKRKEEKEAALSSSPPNTCRTKGLEKAGAGEREDRE